ncbi:hypothetical protein BITS_1710 [Bifidobacterium tsurumiense]|uniref:Uncharacterized protein n=1 Tax=Bifidobacterium tsurumiense TaxID=356829 RepID=A0A087EKV4_9BIFI|nr:hypothetical protein BITS_1710 [Bifidobacterium tsurumiense]
MCMSSATHYCHNCERLMLHLTGICECLVWGIGAAQVLGRACHQRQEYSLLYGDANNPFDRKQCGIAKNKEFNEG